MAGPSKSQREAATHLLSALRQTANAVEGHDESAAAGRVLEALFASLSPVIGAAGVEAIFARSLKLSKAEYPSLGDVLTSSNEHPPRESDVARRLIECLQKLEPAAARESATGLFANFLGLLGIFVGEQLLWQIVNGALPTGAQVEVEETK